MDNNTSYETQAIDINLLSVLDITKDGKVVSAEKWVELWNLVFQHINKIDAFCVDMQSTLDNWHESEIALNEIIEDMQIKYDALSTEFIHYGENTPENPHIMLWVRRMNDISTHCFLTNEDVDSELSSTSENPVQNKVANAALNNKMDKNNPTGTGSFSLNRRSDTVVGNYSFAEGYDTTASGVRSHAEGYYTTASGDTSHAEGTGAQALGSYSHAEGYYTTASSNYQHVQGKYNIADATTYADIIGNGSSDTERSNAATVDWQGNAWYAGDVYVGSTSGTNRDEGSKKLATEEYVDTQITEKTDQTYSPTSANAQSGIAVAEALSGYVVAEVGKGLSSNDFTNEDKEKLYSALQNEDIDQTYSPTSENAQSGKAVAEAVAGGICDEKYFDITIDGAVFLKNEYRGACPSNLSSTYPYAVSDNGAGNEGSKANELPKNLIIPNLIGTECVTSIANGIFLGNKRIKTVTLPDCVSTISDYAFGYTTELKTVTNTENITALGNACFFSSSIEIVKFPNLKTISPTSNNMLFTACANLKYIDIGDITVITDFMFNSCASLSTIIGGNDVTTVGNSAFFFTPMLRSIPFLNNLTKVENHSFVECRAIHDWWNMSNITYGTYSTPKQMNPTDIWSDCTIVETKNPLTTAVAQRDTRWGSLNIGASVGKDTGIPYANSCLFMSIMSAYCSLHNIVKTTAFELEELCEEIDPTLLSKFKTDLAEIDPFIEGLGLAVTTYSTYTQENLQILFNSIASGKYALLRVPIGTSNMQGHSILAYGVRSNKELWVANSDVNNTTLNIHKNLQYSMVYQNMCLPTPTGNIAFKILQLQ